MRAINPLKDPPTAQGRLSQSNGNSERTGPQVKRSPMRRYRGVDASVASKFQLGIGAVSGVVRPASGSLSKQRVPRNKVTGAAEKWRGRTIGNTTTAIVFPTGLDASSRMIVAMMQRSRAYENDDISSSETREVRRNKSIRDSVDSLIPAQKRFYPNLQQESTSLLSITQFQYKVSLQCAILEKRPRLLNGMPK